MTSGRWAILLMDGSPKPEPHHAWYVEGDEDAAEAFRTFVECEIDPAVKILLRPAVAELHWRENIAKPLLDRWPSCATPGDCPLGPSPHPFVPPADTGPCCCRQPWEPAP